MSHVGAIILEDSIICSAFETLCPPNHCVTLDPYSRTKVNVYCFNFVLSFCRNFSHVTDRHTPFIPIHGTWWAVHCSWFIVCCSQSTQVLVPPQQQLVHTTGSTSGANAEVLPSSPTSSHTDYMPATSSAGPSVGPIRHVAVHPTHQASVTTLTVGPSPSSREEPPLSAAESTQVTC
jgi:hypothetical protein